MLRPRQSSTGGTPTRRTGSRGPLPDVVSCDDNRLMKVAGVRELKAHLSLYLREVQAGETVLMTDRGRVGASQTFAEARKALRRAVQNRRINTRQRNELMRAILDFESRCRVLPLDEQIFATAEGEFPVEHVATLDALHLASMIFYQRELGHLRVGRRADGGTWSVPLPLSAAWAPATDRRGRPSTTAAAR